MKNLKFRAWYVPDGETKDGFLKFEQKIVDGELKFVMEDGENQGFIYDFSFPFEDESWIVEQSTFLKDINGVEIFEGDILKCPVTMNRHIHGDFSYRQVIWKPDSFAWVLDGAFAWMSFAAAFGEEGEYVKYKEEDLFLDVEVVGNIHQNRELLKL